MKIEVIQNYLEHGKDFLIPSNDVNLRTPFPVTFTQIHMVHYLTEFIMFCLQMYPYFRLIRVRFEIT